MRFSLFSAVLLMAALFIGGCVSQRTISPQVVRQFDNIGVVSDVGPEIWLQRVGSTGLLGKRAKVSPAFPIDGVIVDTMLDHLGYRGMRAVSLQDDSQVLQESFRANNWTGDIEGLDAYLERKAAEGFEVIILARAEDRMGDPIGTTPISLRGAGVYYRSFFGNRRVSTYFMPVFYVIDVQNKRVFFSRPYEAYEPLPEELFPEEGEQLRSAYQRYRSLINEELRSLVSSQTRHFLRTEGF